MTRICIAALSILMAGVGVMTAVAADKPGGGMKGSTYYKIHPMFSNYPDEKGALQTIDRFGPVGIGIELLQSFARQSKCRPATPSPKETPQS